MTGKREIDEKWTVKCGDCGEEFDLRKAPWCKKYPAKTKLCPNGHCICDKVKAENRNQFREATKEERKYGFKFMLKQEYGGAGNIAFERGFRQLQDIIDPNR